ncbi:MAG: MFS transporter [Bacteroidales bacterium]|nr:MFS transporter [Bacteroidales bacterium]MDD4602241.1 MFS transporter [Bacteroidales bacterium]
MPDKRKIFTRTVLLVSFVSLFTDVASEMLYPIMPVYLKSIGFSVMLIGILEGVAEATAGISKGYFGHLSDVWQKRVPFVRWGYILSAISKPLMAIFTFPVWIFFARTLDRFGKGIRTSARDAMLSDETTKEHKGKVFGFHRSMDTIGAAIGPILALIYLYFYPGQYKWMFFIAFFPGLIAITLTFLLKDRVAKSTGIGVDKIQDQSIGTSPHQPLSTSPKVGFFSYLKYWKKASPDFRYLVSGLLVFTLFNSSDAFLLLALKEQHLSDTLMIGVYIFYNLVYALFSYPIGALADKIGLKTMLITGLLLFSIVYSCMGFATSLFMFGILFFFYGIYAACTEGISKALLSNLADKSETATAIGFYNSAASICTMIASSLAGIFWFTIGPKVMFLISGIAVFLVVCYLAFVFRTTNGKVVKQ